MEGKWCTSLKAVAERKALGEILNAAILRIGSSREFIPAHDEVV
jgi:hypothetical protein